jgi:hypothetical protein
VDRFVWLGKAAEGGYTAIVGEMVRQIRMFDSGVAIPNAVVFVIGKVLKRGLDKEKKTIYGDGDNFDEYFPFVTKSIHFYDYQSNCYRNCVNWWSLIGKRNNVVKDVRIMIANMIWKSREEALFPQIESTNKCAIS